MSRLAPAAAVLLLALAGAAVLLTDRVAAAGAIVAVLLAACLRAPVARRWPYLLGGLGSGLGVFLVSPFLWVEGSHPLWSGPTVPVLGVIDVTREELEIAALNGLRLAGVALAFAAYALFVDHDRLLARAAFARRSAFVCALALRLVPTLERDAVALAESLRGRGIAVAGLRARVQLVAPVVAGSLERSLGMAEAMEARGFGRPGRTTLPGPRWRPADRLAVTAGLALLVAAVAWL